MRYIMRRICLFLVMIAVIVFTGCGQKKKEDPVTVTLWHVYGGQTESPLNDLIDEFNETIGKEENIRVQVGSVTNTNTIHENVLASAFGDPGASKLPDMFVSYPKTVLAMPDDTELVDYYDYFTEEELNEFIPAFLEEGVIHERLSILPVAKSTEVMFINKTAFDRFAKETGAKMEDLKTCPVFARGETMVMQRGAGICTVKSTPEKEKACITFLKWLTEAQKNVEFVTSLGYMPVKQEAFDIYLPEAIEKLSDPMYVSLYQAFLKTQENYTFYTAPQLDSYLNLETKFEELIRQILSVKRLEWLEDMDKLVSETLEDFKAVYTQ